MKKNKTLPDFTKLCPPEQTPSTTYIFQLVYLFFVASIGGFLWEVLLFLAKDNTFFNRGFLYGPWLPIYGVGAVLFYILLGSKRHPLTVFLFSLLLGSALEYVIGWFLDSIWGLRYWDYRSYPLQLNGYICLWSALGFGIAGTIWVCFLAGLLLKIWSYIPQKIRCILLTLLILLFFIDCAAALIFPNSGQGITFSQNSVPSLPSFSQTVPWS